MPTASTDSGIFSLSLPDQWLSSTENVVKLKTLALMSILKGLLFFAALDWECS